MTMTSIEYVVECRTVDGHWDMEPECRFGSAEEAERCARQLRRTEPTNDEGARLEYRVTAECS